MYWNSSPVSGTSTARVTLIGLPLSRVSSSASSSKCSNTRSPSLQISRPRSVAVIAGQGPLSNARRAARTARSMSTSSACAHSAKSLPVAGLWVWKVCPDFAFTHFPSMSNCHRRAVNSLTFGSTGKL